MEGGYAVADFEFRDAFAHFVDGACDVVAVVDFGIGLPFGALPVGLLGWLVFCIEFAGWFGRNAENVIRKLYDEMNGSGDDEISRASTGRNIKHSPVLGVRTTVNNLDNNLTLSSLGNRRVNNIDLGSLANDSFLHGRHIFFGVRIESKGFGCYLNRRNW